MDNTMAVTFAATAANYVPRPAAPALDLIQGSGVRSAGSVWLRGKRLTTATEHDSVRGALQV